MKTKFLLIALLTAATSFAQTNADTTLYQRINALEKSVQNLQTQSKKIQQENATLKNAFETKIDDISNRTSQNTTNIENKTQELNSRISETDNNVKTKTDNVVDSVKSKTTLGIIAIAIVLLISLLVTWLLHRKGATKIETLQQQADKLNEKIVGQFASEMTEMQKISTTIGALSQQTNSTPETEQALIKTLADRITFMEMTLYKMDNSIRGHKQLTKSISQMKDNLLANGYELVDMLGKAYNEGMKVTANFIEDENLEEGKQIITGIIKPQINYKGIMIQSAQITVSQNI